MSCSRTRTRTSSGLSATMLAPSVSMRDRRPAEDARQLERLAEVAVTAGDGDHRAGREDARAGDEALVDGALEPERRSAQVADRGEAAHQRVGGLGAGERGWCSRCPLAIAGAGVGRTSIVCQCMSIRPGISVRPPPSMITVSARRSVAIGVAEMRSILLPRTSTCDGRGELRRSCRRRCGRSGRRSLPARASARRATPRARRASQP